ncbi:MAG: hypothetical protein APR63_00105 [Desulfuromonas sp. SDB]|nr:MAG: hypothetical protein APR63_00105 [Desulfuromonas sp. SDB]
MNKLGLTWKYFFYYLLISVSLSVLIIFFTFQELKLKATADLKQNLLNQCFNTEIHVRHLLSEVRYSDLKQEVDLISNRTGYRISIFDSSGILLTDSKQQAEEGMNLRSLTEIELARKGYIGVDTRVDTTYHQEFMFVAMPLYVKDTGELWGIIRVSSNFDDLNRKLFLVMRNLIIITAVLILLVLLFSIYISRSFSKPIKEIANVADSIGKGNFQARIFFKRKDEIGALSRSINEMSTELQQQFRRLKLEREELKSILESMNDAIMVLDKNKRIVLYNKEIVKLSILDKSFDLFNYYFWEVIRNKQLDDLIKEISTEKRDIKKEINLEDRTYLASGSFINEPPRQEIVIVFHDITELRRLEQIKNDFVANTTHELKTPLTSIKGFAETLQLDLPENQKRYVEIILRNVDRLNNIITDLLSISQLERKESKINLSEVDIKDVLENIITIFSEKLKQKDINLNFHIDENIKFIEIDLFWFEQLLINLIDNAIKYNVPEGRIDLKLRQDEDSIILIVEDTGIGISKDHLNRIFERFYVVNKSRSRKQGGTGLGLSIVKHIVSLHQGTIEVSSTVGMGTVFTICFPKQ